MPFCLQDGSFAVGRIVLRPFKLPEKAEGFRVRALLHQFHRKHSVRVRCFLFQVQPAASAVQDSGFQSFVQLHGRFRILILKAAGTRIFGNGRGVKGFSQKSHDGDDFLIFAFFQMRKSFAV